MMADAPSARMTGSSGAAALNGFRYTATNSAKIAASATNDIRSRFALSAFTSAVLALSLFEGAYASEIIRAGILSIHRGQWEAAFSIGLNTWRTYRLVILPQTLRSIAPPLTGQAISLIKDSALVSTIAIYDLTMQGQTIVAETYLVFEIWFTVAAIYLVITLSLSFTVAFMETRFRFDH